MTTNPNPDRYRRRTEIEARQWTGSNVDAMSVFCSPFDFMEIEPEDRVEDPDQTAAVRTHPHGGWVGLKPGDWVVREAGRYTTASDEEFRADWEPTSSAVSVVPPATNQTALRDRIADAIRDAACPGECGKTEEECAKERIQPFAWHHGRLAVVEGEPEMFADAVLAVLPVPVDRAAVLRWAADRLSRKASALTEGLDDFAIFVGKARAAEAEILEREAEELRRLAAETPHTETPDAPAVVAQPGKETAAAEPPRVMQCTRAILSRPHEPHGWYPQPGMDPVDCPGYCFTEAPQ